jgi:MoaA/NifB/PqqE/SkfB family radical SAM enzyme
MDSKSVSSKNNFMVYKSIVFEIVGFCNAKCRYCPTGNGSMSNHPARTIPPIEFENAINVLLNKGLISSDKSCIDLYNWGEPTLHPELNDILGILHRHSIHFGLSTNALKYVDLNNEFLFHLKNLKFSVPGFSQNSYIRIHDLNFDKVKRNIENYCRKIHKTASNTTLTMAYHIYQFNLDEIKIAYKFCRDNGINFMPYCAYLMDYEQAKAYIDHSINSELLRNASKDLFLYNVDNRTASSPLRYRCPQLDILTIDEFCNVVLCCVLPKTHPDYSLENVTKLSNIDIHKMQENRRVCFECIKLGISYWHNNPLVPVWVNEILNLQQSNKETNSKISRIKELEKEIGAIRNSYSWRFTEPIRTISERIFLKRR